MTNQNQQISCFYNVDQKVSKSMTAMFSDMCFAEVSQVDVKKEPLVEFPSMKKVLRA